MLGRLGELALQRGFPRTHYFAQARAVFSVAAARCKEVFDPPASMTLWSLPGAVEEEFERSWEAWIDQPRAWVEFCTKVQAEGACDLLLRMQNLGVITHSDIEKTKALKRSADGRAVPLPGLHRPHDEVITLLAMGFFRGEPGRLVVPYARIDS